MTLNQSRIISVFGGGSPKPGELPYLEAIKLGSILADRGFTVMTGGYMGTMEAVSRGAFEAGGHVIGVTCREIENWRSTRANPWVKEEILQPSLTSRLEHLIRTCDGAIALPGGAGTLTEISLLWNLTIINSIPPKPMVLIGEGWRNVFSIMFSTMQGYLSQHDIPFLQFAENIEQAVAILVKRLGE